MTNIFSLQGQEQEPGERVQGSRGGSEVLRGQISGEGEEGGRSGQGEVIFIGHISSCLSGYILWSQFLIKAFVRAVSHFHLQGNSVIIGCEGERGTS